MLSLTSNRLNFIPTELGYLTDLEFLSFDDNTLSGPIPTQLGQLSLKYIRLDSNLINFTMPTQVGLLNDLRFFALDDNSLSGTIVTALGQLSALTCLCLGENRLTRSVPSEICQLRLARGGEVTVDCFEVVCDCNCTCAENDG
jgi:Leucine-rich repeat (LRR) protein